MTDFTARDEASIIALADERAKELLPEWTARHTDDLNWATLLTAARMLSVGNFYIDLAFNEYFPTAQLYSSLLRQAKSKNMPVKRRSGASATIRIVRDDATSAITIKRGTSFNSAKGKFYLLEDVVMAIGVTTTNVVARYGNYITGTFGVSDGSALQTYILSDTNIQKDTLKVSVGAEVWEEELDALPMREEENVYKVWLEPNLTLRVDFGDGVFGNIPTNGYNMTYSYLTLDSELGRLPQGNITSCSDSRITTVEQVGATIGGENDESVASLQKALEEWGAVQNRIVTPKDAVFIVKRYAGVYDAKIKTSGMRYDLYIVTANGNPSDAFRALVLQYLNKRKIDIIELGVYALIDREVTIEMNLVVDKKFGQDAVVNRVKETLKSYINNSTNARKDVYIYDIYRYISELNNSGVTKATLTALYKSGLQRVLEDVTMSDNEKAVVTSSSINISATGGL